MGDDHDLERALIVVVHSQMVVDVSKLLRKSPSVAEIAMIDGGVLGRLLHVLDRQLLGLRLGDRRRSKSCAGRHGAPQYVSSAEPAHLLLSYARVR
jgi:hypothetical protein